jgi:protein-disulfide isomerase
MTVSPATNEPAPTRTPVARSLPWLSIVAAFVAGIAAGYLIWGGTPDPVDEPTATEETTRFEVSADDDASIGPANAPVTIIEFSDFACGYCRRFHATTFGELMAAYPGKIRFVYRDFPVLSEESFNAAMAAECAAEQGDFWGFHNALFEGEGGLSMSRYKAIATSLGMDASALETCVTSNRYSDEVTTDAKSAAEAGASGTPTFFINGLPLVGAQPLTQFQTVIDAELQ